MKFNINNYVKVKLTDRGRELIKKNHDAVFSGMPFEFKPIDEDADGWSRWQLWDLMKEFGPHISLGMHAPFETTIDIITDEEL